MSAMKSTIDRLLHDPEILKEIARSAAAQNISLHRATSQARRQIAQHLFGRTPERQAQRQAEAEQRTRRYQEEARRAAVANRALVYIQDAHGLSIDLVYGDRTEGGEELFGIWLRAQPPEKQAEVLTCENEGVRLLAMREIAKGKSASHE